MIKSAVITYSDVCLPSFFTYECSSEYFDRLHVIAGHIIHICIFNFLPLKVYV